MSNVTYVQTPSASMPNFRISTKSRLGNTTSYDCLVESLGGWDMEGNPVEDFAERVRSYREHIELMEILYKHAFEKMGRDPMTGEKWQ